MTRATPRWKECAVPGKRQIRLKQRLHRCPEGGSFWKGKQERWGAVRKRPRTEDRKQQARRSLTLALSAHRRVGEGLLRAGPPEGALALWTGGRPGGVGARPTVPVLPRRVLVSGTHQVVTARVASRSGAASTRNVSDEKKQQPRGRKQCLVKVAQFQTEMCGLF